MKSLCVDGGEYASPGRCFLSREAYEAHVALLDAWRSFQRDVGRMSADDDPQITIENIAAARKVLQTPKVESKFANKALDVDDIKAIVEAVERVKVALKKKASLSFGQREKALYEALALLELV